MADTEKINIDKVIEGLETCLMNYDDKCEFCPYMQDSCCFKTNKREALALLKEQKNLILALEQANATINYLNEEKEKAIKEIEERKAFNLRCEGKPGWLMKGIDVGFNTALDILKDKDSESE